MMTSSSAIDCADGGGGDDDDDERYCVRAHLVAFDLCRALLNCDERTVLYVTPLYRVNLSGQNNFEIVWTGLVAELTDVFSVTGLGRFRAFLFE